MPTLDHEHHELRLEIVVMGGAGAQFVQALELSDGMLRLGEVQGWKPLMALEVFSVDPWAGDGAPGARLEQIVGYIDALVLTDALTEGTHYSSSAVERLSRILGPVKIGIPTVIFGGPALAQEWESLSGKPPVMMSEPDPSHAQMLIKALARTLLRSQMKSTPPPPPAV